MWVEDLEARRRLPYNRYLPHDQRHLSNGGMGSVYGSSAATTTPRDRGGGQQVFRQLPVPARTDEVTFAAIHHNNLAAKADRRSGTPTH
jgi:hypothetical protein